MEANWIVTSPVFSLFSPIHHCYLIIACSSRSSRQLLNGTEPCVRSESKRGSSPCGVVTLSARQLVTSTALIVRNDGEGRVRVDQEASKTRQNGNLTPAWESL